MIIYDLVCANFHQFEGWFRGLEDYESQLSKSLIRCPICDSERIERKVSAPKVQQKANQKPERASNAKDQGSTGSTIAPDPEQAVSLPLAQVSGLDSEQYAQVQKMLKQVHDYIDSNFTDVGNKFSSKVKEMHSGDAEPENIKGNASKEELEELNELGINTMAVPPKPVDKNKMN